jgi:hypothetical protein
LIAQFSISKIGQRDAELALVSISNESVADRGRRWAFIGRGFDGRNTAIAAAFRANATPE